MTSARPAQLSDAVQAIRLGDKPLAREILGGIIAADPSNEQAHIWAAAVAQSPEEAIRYLERVLEMNPRNELATKALATHRLSHRPPPAVARPLMETVAAPLAPPACAPEDPKPAHSVRQYFDTRPDAVLYAPQTPKSILCSVCQHPREATAQRCTHCGCATSLQAFVEIRASHRPADPAAPAVDERIVEQALLRLPAQADPSSPLDDLYGAAIAYLSLHRSGEALPYLEAASALAPRDYHLRILNEEISQRKLVLTVDDSATVRRLVSITLERQGYRVKTAIHGRQGLEKFAAETPAFILLDITMPEMDGYEFCKTIRRKPEGKQIPIVMLSGNDGIFDKVRGKVAGATDYLNKPFHSDVLLNALHKHMKASGSVPAGRIFNLG